MGSMPMNHAVLIPAAGVPFVRHRRVPGRGLRGWVALALAFAAVKLAAQPLSVPLELRLDSSTPNLQSLLGVPISAEVGNPPGSDGRMSTENDSGSALLPTAGQFQGLMSYGAVPGLKRADWLTVSNSTVLRAGTTSFTADLATQMQLPAARSNGVIVMVLRRAQVGTPYFGRRSTLAFGSIVSAPTTDENGLPLVGISPTEYWLRQPDPGPNPNGLGYYWSPNARQVFAIQPGPLRIRWIKAAYSVTKPDDYDEHPESYYVDGGNFFRVYIANYVVSGSPSKPPRKMYWTERGFRDLGKPIAVPSARVGGVNIVYNNNFPRTVDEEYTAPGISHPTDGTTNAPLPELRTLWYDQQQGNIYAYNREGRVFLELLGDTRPDGVTREPLGYEIVDVFKEPTRLDVMIELGERITPPVADADLGANASDLGLSPEPVASAFTTPFAYRHEIPGSQGIELYAIRETANLNDYLVHWMEVGQVGLRWPARFGRYQLRWPTDAAKYSQYLRPLVATEQEARQTAVLLPTDNAPTIQYQDPLDRPRARFTESFAFYTFLDPAHPVHRTLLMFNAGENIAFERVFSWLDTNLKATDYAQNPIVTGLDAWDAGQQRLNWSEPLRSPRVVEAVVEVGQRIRAPMGELGADAGNYLAGYIHQEQGDSFNPHSYKDPFAVGFAAANLGSIIPVNVLPRANKLEVWWFRDNHANTSRGFKTVYWPSALGIYTIQWPAQSREIVLASKMGSAPNGPLSSYEANGQVYYQNTPGQPGYNPNEEHAIMAAGTAYATRDDLNLTQGTVPGKDYSSEPFVLIEFLDQDARPSMSVFHVHREKPEAGWVFDYIVPAGQLIEPPMPLPLLRKPVEGSGDKAVTYTTEPTAQDGDLPGGWVEDRDAVGARAHYRRFTYRDRKQDFWVYRGPHAGPPALISGTFHPDTGEFTPLDTATAVVGEPFRFIVHASRQAEYLTMTAGGGVPGWLQISGLSLVGTPAGGDAGDHVIELVVRDLYLGDAHTNRLTLSVLDAGTVATQGSWLLPCTNSFTGTIARFVDRPPFLAASPVPGNSFTMRFYYRTDVSFAWPGYDTPPPTGSIVPYLRPLANGVYQGDPTSKTTPALDIVYRPVWPERDPKDATKPLPEMPYGLTLAKPRFGLPGVKDWRTAVVLYQQSIAADLPAAVPSVVLHDPIREKTADLEANDFAALPRSVKTEVYQGRTYFPNLPPHLAGRVFFDPNRSARGSLVLAGEYKAEQTGGDYFMLNVLRGADLQAVKDLCPVGDTDNHDKWVALVEALATPLQTFMEDPTVPGTYIPDSTRTESIGVGALAEISNENQAAAGFALSATGPGRGYVTLVEAGGNGKFTQPGDPVALHVLRVVPTLYPGELKVIPAANPLSELVTFQHTLDLAGRYGEYEYEWKIAPPVDGQPPAGDATMTRYQSLIFGPGLPRYLLGGTGIQVLGDNYLVLRYRPKNPIHPLFDQWSDWTAPQLAEGWIKRVLAGINPFNQRVKDLFNNRVNTDVSLLTQAGHRWEGDVALNLDSINQYGLIEIYETVLRRGRSMSIEAGYNYGPANDALLLAAGYLNDLYMLEGNEAWADAANPTIGIGTANHTYGDIATALFAFKGQVPTLLDEELALLRGRDDFLVPGVQTAPVYNRMYWNYTRGIDAGEVIYALNYNIQEDPNRTPNGVIDASDAAIMFPQGHGDAYGHYLTALKGYYSLLMNSRFDWVPRSEAVLVLGQPVTVDYQDERKFATAAAALARAGRQVFDLTWREDYQSVPQSGWQHFGALRVNAQRQFRDPASGQTTNSTRFWGLDHWASRTAQADYLNWVVGNAVLPAVDPNPNHEGVQKVDRTTVPELKEIALAGASLQAAMDSAESGLTPLGVSANAIAFDLNPLAIANGPNTHFDQIYQRATTALNNAVAAFDDAKDVTSMLRSEQDSLADFQSELARQELAYTSSLVELYGTPYTDDIGPNGTWQQGYEGPDLVHYMYVDLPEKDFPGLWNYVGNNHTFNIDIQDFPEDWATNYGLTSLNVVAANDTEHYQEGTHYVTMNVDRHGFGKPDGWVGKRRSPGRIQQAISKVIAAHTALLQSLFDEAGTKADLDRSIGLFETRLADHRTIREYERGLLLADQTLEAVQAASEVLNNTMDSISEDIETGVRKAATALPTSFVVGLASGGDLTSAARAALEDSGFVIAKTYEIRKIVQFSVVKALELATSTSKRWLEFEAIAPLEWDQEVRSAVAELGKDLEQVQALLANINVRLREYDDAQQAYHALLAEGDRLQAERQVARQRAAAVVQGYRTRDAGFRIFRNEKLERYKTLFDLASRYAFLAANAYDYETGLLGTAAGRSFVNRIINARALGVVRGGQPQFAGSNTGDPGLSSALAEMKADWEVLRGRLGFNNPDAYGTTVSLRTENYRILPGTNSDPNWKDVLLQHRVADLLADADVRRYCRQISPGDGQPVPGIVIDFSTTIAGGYNLFGQKLAAGDHAFSPSSFATKIFGVGVALEGYRGMDDPNANGGQGGSSPADPDLGFLDPLALAATPYIYLIPVGVDSMRSPPLGDTSQIRTWTVDDVAVPLPFNIGASDFSTHSLQQSSDFLTEPFFAIRKHQAFRPVSSPSIFGSMVVYWTGGELQRSQYTNTRLLGRSVWNSRWKLIIPGNTLLNDSQEGLDRFVNTVRDIKLYFSTYSYSGN